MIEQQIILTNRLKLIAATPHYLELLLQNPSDFEQSTGYHLEEAWSQFGTEPLQYSLNQFKDPSQINWWTYLPVLKTQALIIGSGGYKGKPENGIVEIGYEIAPSYRNQSFAKEFARGLIQHAFKFPQVSKVIAHTLAETNASGHILECCGFQFSHELLDPEDGLIWKWELSKLNWEEYQKVLNP